MSPFPWELGARGEDIAAGAREVETRRLYSVYRDAFGDESRHLVATFVEPADAAVVRRLVNDRIQAMATISELQAVILAWQHSKAGQSKDLARLQALSTDALRRSGLPEEKRNGTD